MDNALNAMDETLHAMSQAVAVLAAQNGGQK